MLLIYEKIQNCTGTMGKYLGFKGNIEKNKTT